MYKREDSLVNFFGQVLLVGIVVLATAQISYSQGGQSPQNVTVVNTASNPIPTTLQGTANVNITNSPTVNLSATGNSVQSQQSGIWNVGIIGAPVFAISSSANTVQAQQTGSWNVGINGIPTVNLASGSAVGITGTANVSLTPGSSVMVANSATNPIPVQNVGGPPLQTTLLLNSGIVTIPNTTGSTNLGDFDASTYSKIRVVTKSNCDISHGTAIRVVVLENGQPVQVIEEIHPCVMFPSFNGVSKIIDMPGTTLRITLSQTGTLETQQIVQVVVYGR